MDDLPVAYLPSATASALVSSADPVADVRANILFPDPVEDFARAFFIIINRTSGPILGTGAATGVHGYQTHQPVVVDLNNDPIQSTNNALDWLDEPAMTGLSTVGAYVFGLNMFGARVLGTVALQFTGSDGADQTICVGLEIPSYSHIWPSALGIDAAIEVFPALPPHLDTWSKPINTDKFATQTKSGVLSVTNQYTINYQWRCHEVEVFASGKGLGGGSLGFETQGVMVVEVAPG